MEFQTSMIGLVIIILAWIVQLYSSWKGDREIKTNFIILYCLGLAWLVIVDSYINGLIVVPALNFIVLVLVCIVMIKVSKRKKKK